MIMIFRGMYMKIPYVFKKCNNCGKWLVASTDNFYKLKNGKYGLEARCKECAKNQNKRYREANREKDLDRKKQWYEANKEQQKQYREANRDKRAEYNKQYREANKEKIAKQRKQRYQDNKEKELERNKQYRQTPQGQVALFNAHNKRRHKKATQGTGVTPDQWLEMMQYFDWRCAYTGERLTDKTRSGDHVVPLDAGGDDMVWNMVPMLRNLNSSKQAKDILEWYKEQSFYSEDRLAKIYEWQEYARKKWNKGEE